MKYYVYFLIDPRTNTVFYVGFGTLRLKRHLTHIEEFKFWDRNGRIQDSNKGLNLKKIRKIAQIIDAGFEVKYEIVFKTNNKQEALLQEVNCIAAFGRENLTNLTDGGEGHTGFRHSKETKEKMRLAKADFVPWNKGKKMSKEYRINHAKCRLGKRHSEKTKEKIKAKLTGRASNVFTAEYREKLSIAGKRRQHSEETKKKISESNKRTKSKSNA